MDLYDPVHQFTSHVHPCAASIHIISGPQLEQNEFAAIRHTAIQWFNRL